MTPKNLVTPAVRLELDERQTRCQKLSRRHQLPTNDVVS
jgi:hypothetical protein